MTPPLMRLGSVTTPWTFAMGAPPCLTRAIIAPAAYRAIAYDRRGGRARLRQQIIGQDLGNHADPREDVDADRVRSPCAYPAGRGDQPSALRAGPQADRQRQDLGQIVGRLCRHQGWAADLFRYDPSGAGVREGRAGTLRLGQRLAAPVRAREEAARRGAARPAHG